MPYVVTQTPEQLATSIKAEILQDIRDGRVPANVADYSALHNHVDANMYGGSDDAFAAFSTDEQGNVNEAESDAFYTLHNAATRIVDAWIVAGGMGRAVRFSNRLRQRETANA